MLIFSSEDQNNIDHQVHDSNYFGPKSAKLLIFYFAGRRKTFVIYSALLVAPSVSNEPISSSRIVCPASVLENLRLELGKTYLTKGATCLVSFISQASCIKSSYKAGKSWGSSICICLTMEGGLATVTFTVHCSGKWHIQICPKTWFYFEGTKHSKYTQEAIFDIRAIWGWFVICVNEYVQLVYR